jgi:small subunit ribosomal protein S9
MPSASKTTNKEKSTTKTAKVTEKAEATVEKKVEKVEEANFSSKYTSAVGRRKTAVAQVRLYEKGKGLVFVNDKKIKDYFPADRVGIALEPLKEANRLKDFDISVIVKGGGVQAQVEAIRHGVARALLSLDEGLREVFKVQSWLTRDSRKKERKKPGLKKARKRPQWSKR